MPKETPNPPPSISARPPQAAPAFFSVFFLSDGRLNRLLRLLRSVFHFQKSASWFHVRNPTHGCTL